MTRGCPPPLLQIGLHGTSSWTGNDAATMIPDGHVSGSRAPVAEGELTHKQKLLAGIADRPAAGAMASAAAPAASCCQPPPVPMRPPALPSSHLPGQPYDANDGELVDDRIRCRKLLHQLNSKLEYDDVEGRKNVLRELLGGFDEGAAVPLPRLDASISIVCFTGSVRSAPIATAVPLCFRLRWQGVKAASAVNRRPNRRPSIADAHCLPAENPPWFEPPFFCDFGYNIFVGELGQGNSGAILGSALLVFAGCRLLYLPPALSSISFGSGCGLLPPTGAGMPIQYQTGCLRSVACCCCLTDAAGKNFYCNFNCCFLDCGEVRIGDRVLLGPAVQIYPVGHHVDPAERSGTQGFEHAKPVVIGDDVWLGGGCIIMCVGTASGRGRGEGQSMLVNACLVEMGRDEAGMPGAMKLQTVPNVTPSATNSLPAFNLRPWPPLPTFCLQAGHHHRRGVHCGSGCSCGEGCGALHCGGRQPSKGHQAPAAARGGGGCRRWQPSSRGGARACNIAPTGRPQGRGARACIENETCE